jgi:(1->4)-alpha-D-glucan 1-alpha-D-glucosylmutase
LSAPGRISELATALRATYRLQLTSGFGFGAAQAVVPYLRDLGISHLYLSPSLQARPGSGHGYDVIDPARLSDDLGGGAEFRHLAQAARDAGLGIVLDVVPNHMAADDENPYWADLERRATFYDVDPATGRHRRFFDVDELAGLRQEDPDVFEATHGLVLSLVADGSLDGLRIDHVDGLADPAGYLSRLAEHGPRHVWVEKILDSGEFLRDWPVTGTVGYEFLNDVCALYVDPAGEATMTSIWERVSGEQRSFAEVALQAKLEQAAGPFRADVEWVARELGSEPPGGVEQLARGLASFPIYRTYVEPWSRLVTDADRSAIGAAQLHPTVAAMLALEHPAPPGFITRFQQTTPALTAKGVEDTAFYRYGRLLALNDVGGDPSRFGIDVAHFHAGNLDRAARFPESLLTTQTHDAKRSGDVRARIAMLSSVAEQWREHVERWFVATEPLRDAGAPDDTERYFIFQTLAGAWPISAERLERYMQKALREAKRNTSWIERSDDWERAVGRFCRALYSCRPFLDDFEPFVEHLAPAGERAALGQLVLKLTSPGIPDTYQGDELPNRALVDPDNRRPVDWDYCQASLRRLMGGSRPVRENYKQFLTMRLLGLRARRPEPFAGGYEPLDVGGATCAFVRGGDVVVLVSVRDENGDAGFEPPRGHWHDVVTGEQCSFTSSVRLRSLLGDRGFAVFERAGSSEHLR